MTRIPKFVFIPAVILVGALLLAASYQFQQQMNRIRVEERLIDTEIVENAPPIVAFTTMALGSFRGLIANYLWLRTHNMQDQGRYYEMVQLASWITKLQPRFTGATTYLAWNMAYNVSVTFSRPEDRWRWVRRGIELIRDEALVYNPGDPQLYRELGWIYQHKLGQEMDNANIYYKWQLAEEIMEVLGTYPIDWDKWEEMPQDESGLKEKLTKDHSLWDWLEERGTSLEEIENDFRAPDGFTEEIGRELEGMNVRNTLNIYFRNRLLEQRLKLDSGKIAELNRKYGQLDWRLPEAHAIYWASRGLDVAEGGVDLHCERMIFQSLKRAFVGGKLLYFRGQDENLDRPVVQFIPNVEIVDAVDQAYVDAIERHSDNQSIQPARHNFLVQAVVTLYTFGRKEKASDYLGILRREYDAAAEYRLSLEDFVLRELAGQVSEANFNQAQSLVQGYLWLMCKDLAFGEFERATVYERIARQIWKRYMKNIGEDTEERRGLPPYETMRDNIVKSALENFQPALARSLRAALRQLDLYREE